ncbi:MAG: SDR family oxidoreductase [Pseudomonadota bacterium]
MNAANSELFSVAGKVALVTGAGSGLGESFAKTLAAHGCSVVCVARRTDTLDRVVAEIEETGGSAMAATADVTDNAAIGAAFDAAEAAFGIVDVLVNCAGIQATADTLEMSEEEFTGVLNTNVSGMWRTAKHCAQRLAQAQAPGSIINISSILGHSARPAMASYCASKAAVDHMTRSMALDLVSKNIRVNCLAPGYFETELTSWWLQSEEGQQAKGRLPIGRFGSLEELSGPLLLLASDASSYMTGSVLTVDAGHSTRIAE